MAMIKQRRRRHRFWALRHLCMRCVVVGRFGEVSPAVHRVRFRFDNGDVRSMKMCAPCADISKDVDGGLARVATAAAQSGMPAVLIDRPTVSVYRYRRIAS